MMCSGGWWVCFQWYLYKIKIIREWIKLSLLWKLLRSTYIVFHQKLSLIILSANMIRGAKRCYSFLVKSNCYIAV